jgi:hypothetical protein
MDFTLPEAKSLIGRSVTVKPERREEVDFDGLFRFSEQGQIIGISGQDTPQGLPEIAVVIQCWFADDNAIPELVILKKEGTHLRRDTVIPQWFQASKATAASDGHAVHC